MSTDIVRATPATSLPDMVRYAEHLANANLLPSQYRKQPANVLYAMEYGRTLGITPLAAITGIHVIEGKPSASAALIGALVRQAGHKLRVTGNSQSATAQIIRSDDPDFTYEVTWELRRNERGNPSAEDAGLLGKDVWKKYAAAMLKARAISQVARDACEEVLFGLHYTPEELGAYVDQDGNPVDAPVQPLRAVSGKPPTARGRDFLHEAYKAADADTVRRLWQEAKADGRPDHYLESIAQVGRDLAAATPQADPVAEPEPVEAEVVEDEHTAAVDALRGAALAAGVAATIEADFAQSYGVSIAEATAEQLAEMTQLLAGAA
ncbi:hypothetical protein [Kitasatospora sp. NPDC056531]|uniref:hypothetical protein n=1 Tax=Kitasatospora sp. NPDC056531 TaxID=3345856 RepID=UPI00367386EB